MITPHVAILVINDITVNRSDEGEVIGQEEIMMLNDYVSNPVRTYLEVTVMINGKETKCTKFILANGLWFISPNKYQDFITFNEKMKQLKENIENELKVTETCKLQFIPNGMTSYNLN